MLLEKDGKEAYLFSFILHSFTLLFAPQISTVCTLRGRHYSRLWRYRSEQKENYVCILGVYTLKVETVKQTNK